MAKISNDWQKEMQNAIHDSHDLLDLLGLKTKALGQPKFSCRVPKTFVKRMEKGNPNDPLLLQVLPRNEELIMAPGYSRAPLFEERVSPIPGLIHKYHGRALLTITGACGVHCRYCFRQNTEYGKQLPQKNIERYLEYFRERPEITEVILSGGDPLSLSDEKLMFWLNKLSELPNIKRLRVHTRLPVVIPQRITESLVTGLDSLKVSISIVFHINHPNELDEETLIYFSPLVKTKIMLWNQSVLLKNINDDVDILYKLSTKLIDHNIAPYYLHFLDRVYGSEHFSVTREEAIAIHHELKKISPGYMVPRLVEDSQFRYFKNELIGKATGDSPL